MIALVLVGAGVFAFVFAQTYRPLQKGGFFGTDGGTFRDTESFDEEEGARVFTYVHGQTFTVAFSIRNGGSFPVTVASLDDLPTEDPPFFLMVAEQVLQGGSDDGPGFGLRPVDPFQPFVLEPGRQRVIGIRARFAGCGRYSEGGSTTWEVAVVRFRAFGLSHTMEVPLPMPVTIEAPDREDCPERTPPANG